MENQILLFPDMFIDNDSKKIHVNNTNIGSRNLKIACLYWDKIILTNNNLLHIGFDSEDGVLDLKREGILDEVNVQIKAKSGDMNTLIYEAMTEFFIDSIARTDVNIIANNANKVFISKMDIITPKQGELITFVNALPEPAPDTQLNDILEFRLKRKDELRNLMIKLNELEIRVSKAENKDVEIKSVLNEIDKSCADVIRLYKEGKIRFNLSNMKFNFSMKEIIKYAGTAFAGSLTIGLPQTAAIIAATTAGIGTFVEINDAFSFNNIDKSNPFNYVGEISTRLN